MIRMRALLSLLSIFGLVPALSASAIANPIDDVLDSLPGMIGDVGDLITSDRLEVTVGAGPVYAPTYDGSDNMEFRVGALANVKYKGLQISGSELSVGFLDFDGISIGPVLSFNFGRDEDDDPDLAGLGNVGTAVEVGAYIAYQVIPNTMVARLRVRKDIASGHGGTLVDLDARYRLFEAADWTVSAVGGTRWASKDFMDSFFGIDPAQAAASGYGPYDAGSGFKHVNLGLVGTRSMGDNWRLRAVASYRRLLSDAADSPIVKQSGSADQFTTGLFALYAF